MPTASLLLIIPAAYLLGCFTTGYYLVRCSRGQDIRTHASGNVGSRNVGRLLGGWGFALTFIGDAGKGVLAVWLARHLGGGELLATATLTAVTAGHIWPVQLRFRGGKGFATFAGGLLLLQPHLLLLSLGLAALFYPLLRRTTIAGLAALVASPLVLALMSAWGRTPLTLAGFVLYCLLVLLVLFAHRANIRQAFTSVAPQE